MKFLENLGERLLGAVIALVTLVSFVVAGLVGLFELPRYLKLRSK
jgi:hypothetical protein